MCDLTSHFASRHWSLQACWVCNACGCWRPSWFGQVSIEPPTNIAAADSAAEHHRAASLAASIGAVRGDLWADSAFTDANLLWSKKGAHGTEDPLGTLPRARTSLDRALDDSPHLSSAWLFLAGLASRFPSLGLDATELLKMSYYTGPSEQNLIPLRLRIAVQSNDFSDVEIRQFVSRDIHFLLSQKQTSAIS